MISTQSEVKALLDTRSECIRMKDLERLLSLYSPDITYFDVVPPLRYTGSVALRGRFLEWFERYRSSIIQEIADVAVLESGDVAVAFTLIRSGGTLTSGREVGFWVRATTCCQRSNDRWVIVHEHISLPVDLSSGSAVTDLQP